MAIVEKKKGKKAARAGFNMGARQIDCEDYLPEPGDWEETNVLYDFGDGWLICEDRTTYDRKLMAKLTKTCVGGEQFINRCYPGMTEDEWWAYRRHFHERQVTEAWWEKSYSREVVQKRLESAKKQGDNWMIQDLERKASTTPETYEAYIDAQVENERRLANGKVQGFTLPTPVYRLGHVRDPEGRPRACILFVAKEGIKGCEGYNPKLHVNYANSNDLGQGGFINIDGVDFRMTEIRLGTGRTGPREALERCGTFYQEVVGEWDQEAFERVNGTPYGAINVREDIEKFRRKDTK